MSPDGAGDRGTGSLALDDVLDAIDDVFYVVAPGERLRRWNDRLPAVSGYTDREIARMRTPEFLVPERRDEVPAHAAEVRETGAGEFRADLLTEGGERIPFEFRERRLIDADGEPVGRCGIGRDVSDRERRKGALRREKALTDTLLDTIPDLLYAFDEDGQFLRWNSEVRAVTGHTDGEIRGMHPLEFVAPEDRSHAAEAIAAVFEDGTTQTIEADLRTKDGERIPHEFTGSRIEDDLGDQHGLVGTARDVSDRKRRERRLERQRDELQRLHRINALIRDVNRALVEADDRPAVEEALCECLTAEGGYALAWVGEPDLGEGRLVPSAAAGDGEGYLDEVTVTFGDGADGPATRAVRDGATEVARPIESPAATRWAEVAASRGLGSGVAVPVTFGGTVYAVLNVYARDPGAFDERERAILSELGETVGYALNAILRRDVLTSDEAVELEFRIEGGPPELLDPTRDGSARLLFDRSVRVDERVLWYVTATGVDAERIRRFEDVEFIHDVTLLSDDGGDRQRLEIAAADPPLTAALASHGGRLRRMTVEDGELDVLAELPPGADLRAVKRSLRDVMPDAALLAQRHSPRDPESIPEVRAGVTEALTGRQRTVLEAAFAAGYFERPRRTTGDELADSLDITRSTFHQHLRVATRKLLEVVLDSRDEPD